MSKESSKIDMIPKLKRGSSSTLILIKFALFLCLLIAGFSVIFHIIMIKYEGVSYSRVTGIYWVLTTMTTLGFGDITYHSDIGKVFSIIVLISGLILLLIVLPYAFISFFMAPYVERMLKNRIPKIPTKSLNDHFIICGEGPIASNLVEKLQLSNRPFIFIEQDINKAESLCNDGLPVVCGDLSEKETYKKVNIDSANMIYTNQSDVVNSQVALTVRGISDIPIIALAEVSASIDILEFAGCNYVLPVKEILGKYLVNRCMAGTIHSNPLGSFGKLKIVEFPVLGTPFSDKRLSELKIKEITGAIIIGVWERGEYFPPKPEYTLTTKSVLLLIGEKEKLQEFDAYMAIYLMADKPIVVIGAGAVGLSVARELDKKGTPYALVDIKECKQPLDKGRFVQGDAKEREVLEKAGIMKTPTVIITTNDDGTNGYLTLYCRSLNKKLRIITRANQDRNESAIHKAGADFVVSYPVIGASLVSNILQKGRLTILIEGLHIFRYKSPKTLVGKTIAEAKISDLTDCNVIAIDKKNGKLINLPPSTTGIEDDDTLIMIGNIEQEQKFKAQFVDKKNSFKK
ncbi:MAG: potassium channel family protein [Candidatus Anammoxibacter sp.]